MKKIILISLCAALFASQKLKSQTYNVSVVPANITLSQNDYVDDLSIVWNIDVNEPITLAFDYNIDIEGMGYDYVLIYEIDNNGTENLIKSIGDIIDFEGTQSGTISTGLSNGKARIKFFSDGSESGYYGGFEGVDIVVTKNLVLGTISAEKIGIGTDDPLQKLHINSATRNGIRLESGVSTGGLLDFMFTKTNHTSAQGLSTYWNMCYRNDGYFSGTDNGGLGTSLEFYTGRQSISTTGEKYYVPLCFRADGNIVLASTKNAAGGKVGIGITTKPLGLLDMGRNLGVQRGLRLGDYLELNEMEYMNNASVIGFNAVLTSDGSTDDGELVANQFKPVWYGASNASGMILKMNAGGVGNLDFYGIDWGTDNSNKSLTDFEHVLRLNTDGTVGVGTTDTHGYKLAVAGKIGATEIIIEDPLGGADFVFEEDYNLRSLDEVSDFIKENKHLPEVPSAKSMMENGVNMAEMNKVLLQKVEELTLYMIEMKKQNEFLLQEINLLKQK